MSFHMPYLLCIFCSMHLPLVRLSAVQGWIILNRYPAHSYCHCKTGESHMMLELRPRHVNWCWIPSQLLTSKSKKIGLISGSCRSYCKSSAPHLLHPNDLLSPVNRLVSPSSQEVKKAWVFLVLTLFSCQTDIHWSDFYRGLGSWREKIKSSQLRR